MTNNSRVAQQCATRRHLSHNIVVKPVIFEHVFLVIVLVRVCGRSVSTPVANHGDFCKTFCTFWCVNADAEFCQLHQRI